MFIKPLSYYLDRFKLSLRSSQCCVCKRDIHLDTPKHEAQFVCTPCQDNIAMRDIKPVASGAGWQVYAACDFPLKLKQWLYQLKFDHQQAHALQMTEVLLHYWYQLLADKTRYADNTAGNTIIIPIPAHANLQQKPHLASIFQPFASELGADYMQNILSWSRHVHPQHTLYGRKSRHENVRDAFHVDTTKLNPNEVHNIVLVDDLFTTGSTMTEALQALKVALPKANITGLTLCYLPMGLSRGNNCANSN